MAVREISTELTLSGEKEFNAEMKAVNSNLKTLKSDMSAVSAEFDGNSNSVEALTRKQSVLNDIQAQNAAKVQALRSHYEKMVETYGENSAKADKYRQQLNAAIIAEQKAAKAAEENADALRKAAKAAEQYTPKTKVLADGVIYAKNTLSDFGKAIVAAAKNLPILSEAIDLTSWSVRGVKAIGAMTGATVALTTAAAGAGLAAVHLMTSYAKEQAEAVKKINESGAELTENQRKWLEYSNNLDSLDTAVNSAKAAIGGILLPVLSDLSSEGAAFLNDFSAAMEGAAGDTKAQGQIMAEYVAKGANLIKEKLPEYMETGKALLQGLGEGLEESGPELLEIGTDLIMDLLDGIIAAAPAIGDGAMQLVTTLTQTLMERGPDLITSAAELVSQLVSGIASNLPMLAASAVDLVARLVLALMESAPQLLLAGLELVLGITAGILSGLGEISQIGAKLIIRLVNAIDEKAGEVLAIGRNIVEGIWNGISSGTEWIYGKISGWVSSVLDFIKGKLGIHSPSTVFRDEIGVYMAQGIGVGFQQEMASVNRQIAASINTAYRLPTLPRDGVGRYYADRNGNTINLYFYAQQITEENMSMVIDMVNRKLGEEIA